MYLMRMYKQMVIVEQSSCNVIYYSNNKLTIEYVMNRDKVVIAAVAVAHRLLDRSKITEIIKSYFILLPSAHYQYD